MCTTLKRHHRRGSYCWRELIRALERSGFAFTRNSGSHAIYVHRPSGHAVAVLRGGARDAKNGTLSKLLREVHEITGSELDI